MSTRKRRVTFPTSPPSSSLAKSTIEDKESPRARKRRKKSAKTMNNGLDMDSAIASSSASEIQKNYGRNKNDTGQRQGYRPYAIVNRQGLLLLELEGKKNKQVRRTLKDTKKCTTIYANQQNESKKIVPFFRGIFPFSNFYPCKFQVGTREFCCSEQFYHFCKAIAFENEVTSEQLMQTTNPAALKKIGRRVNGFDEKPWEAISILAMVIALMHGAELIEASPFDGRWGAKRSIKQIVEGQRWTGKNLLGRILMALRVHFLTPESNFLIVQRELNPYEEEMIPTSAINAFATEFELLLADALVREFHYFQ